MSESIVEKIVAYKGSREIGYPFSISMSRKEHYQLLKVSLKDL